MNMEGEDTAQVSVKFSDGSVGLILQSWASGMDQGISGIRILGRRAISITDALYHNGERIDSDVEYGDSFKRQAQAFVDAVRRGTPPASTLDDVKNTLRVIYATPTSEGKVTRF